MSISNNSGSKIIFLGAGNVAGHLAKKLYSLGFNILQIYSRGTERAEELAEEVDSTPITDINALSVEGDIYIIAVSDDAISQLASEIRLPGKLVVHTSGSVPMEVLRPISDSIGVLYPLQTFTKGRVVDWEKVPFCLEASDKDTYQVIEALARPISNALEIVSSINGFR